MRHLHFVLSFTLAVATVAVAFAALGQTRDASPPAPFQTLPGRGPGMPPAMPGFPPPMPGFPPPPMMMMMMMANQGGPLATGQTPPSPSEMCLEGVAIKAGFTAYLKARINVSPQSPPPQIAAWQDVETLFKKAEAEERDGCARLPATIEMPSVVKGLTLAEERLSAALRGLQALAPAMRRLYETLSVEQRNILDRIVPPPMPPV